MAGDNFDDVLFIHDGDPATIDPKTRFVYNENGRTKHLMDPMGTLIPITREDPSLRLGQSYTGIAWKERTINPGTKFEYVLTQFDFHSSPVVYQPLRADTRTCQAFGITYLQSGQSVSFEYPQLGMVKSPYTYGVWAGHQSPYIGSNRNRELLTINATDLEFHAFPHVFSSQDALPLVISVARWFPAEKTIYLADLWVDPGNCLYIPPKHGDGPCVDMHGNRNSAFACWGRLDRNALMTETTLGDEAVFEAPATKPHYHAEPHPTVHLKLT